MPMALMLPPAIFKEYGDHGVPNERAATYDLQHAGFLVFQVNHRLVTNHLPGQHSYGIAPAQTDDAERHILAALADPQCNGSIYLIGGSAGGCLALWCALDSATHTATGWSNAARLHIKAVVSFSGVTDPSNWNHPGLTDEEYKEFEKRVDNYVQITSYDATKLYAASPVSLITTGVATSSPPVMLYGSIGDSVSYVQQDEMKTALTGIAPTVTESIFTGDAHAYDNWHVISPITNNCVSTDVINFLKANP